MKITTSTALTQKATMFADGEGGSCHQEYSIFADGEDLDVKMMASRKSSKEKFSRCFFVDGNRYETFEDAAKSAGHEWLIKG